MKKLEEEEKMAKGISLSELVKVKNKRKRHCIMFVVRFIDTFTLLHFAHDIIIL